ncbi:hypothetical protein GCM10007881_65180 [Mesorhizobium huakuii]|nr:hypothetical protein [Mesorhizobium huakuii]GLQ82995.1 hypothetical protein GCM10007881_65180 [Mesorhizobium huakuii]
MPWIVPSANAEPESATPAWRTVLSTPEAVPDIAVGTEDSSAVVMAGTARPMPTGRNSRRHSSDR